GPQWPSRASALRPIVSRHTSPEYTPQPTRSPTAITHGSTIAQTISVPMSGRVARVHAHERVAAAIATPASPTTITTIGPFTSTPSPTQAHRRTTQRQRVAVAPAPP